MKSVTQYDPTFLDESVPYTLELMTPAAGTKTGCIDVGRLAELRRLDVDERPHHRDAGCVGDRDRRVHALQLLVTGTGGVIEEPTWM